MAMTVIGFFHNFEQMLQVLEDFVINDYNPGLIKLTFVSGQTQHKSENYDNTREEAQVILFKHATFGAEITGEDCFYYAHCLNKGDALLTIQIPTALDKGRTWEDGTARNLKKVMLESGAFDCETHRIYTNRAALTTYPQTRYMDPLGANQVEKNRTHSSGSLLNGEVSNVISNLLTTNYLDKLEDQAGWRILSATTVLALFDFDKKEKRKILKVSSH